MAAQKEEEELELSPRYGKNPAATVCTKCQRPTGKTVELGRIWQWRCLKCGNILVAKYGNHCRKCGTKNFLDFKRLTEFDGSVAMVPLGLCDPCQTVKEEEDAAVKAGAYRWKCEDCKSEGWFPVDSDMHKALKKQYGDTNLKGITLTKSKCPVCHVRKNKAKKERRRAKSKS